MIYLVKHTRMNSDQFTAMRTQEMIAMGIESQSYKLTFNRSTQVKLKLSSTIVNCKQVQNVALKMNEGMVKFPTMFIKSR